MQDFFQICVRRLNILKRWQWQIFSSWPPLCIFWIWELSIHLTLKATIIFVFPVLSWLWSCISESLLLNCNSTKSWESSKTGNKSLIPQISGVFSESVSIGTSSEKVELTRVGTGVTVPEQFDVLSDVIECIWELMACNRGRFFRGEREVDSVEVWGSFCRVLDMLKWLI